MKTSYRKTEAEVSGGRRPRAPPPTPPTPRRTPPLLFAVVGMAALFTSIVRAPLTGIVLILEMTSSYPLMLPLLAACFIAYALADLLHDRPIYEALLERDLVRGQTREAAQGGGRRSSRFWSRPVRRSTAAASATSACRQVVY